VNGCGLQKPWLESTDRPLSVANVAWYSPHVRITWSSMGLNRAGWPWEQTKMSDPRQAQWRWLAIALAAEAVLPLPLLEQLPATHPARQRAPPRGRILYPRPCLVLLQAIYDKFFVL
jgi:hypothetical protein